MRLSLTSGVLPISSRREFAYFMRPTYRPRDGLQTAVGRAPNWQAPTRRHVASIFTSAPRDPEIGAYFPRFHYTTECEFRGRHAEMTATRPKTLVRALVGLLCLGVAADARRCVARSRRTPRSPGLRSTAKVTAPNVFYPVTGRKRVKDLKTSSQQAPRHRHHAPLQRRRLRLAPRHRPDRDQRRPGQLPSRSCQQRQRPGHRATPT